MAGMPSKKAKVAKPQEAPSLKALEQRIAKLEEAVQRIERSLAPGASVLSVRPPFNDAVLAARWKKSQEDDLLASNQSCRRVVASNLAACKRYEAMRGSSIPEATLDQRIRNAERLAACYLNELWDRGYRLRLHGCKKTVRPAIAH